MPARQVSDRHGFPPFAGRPTTITAGGGRPLPTFLVAQNHGRKPRPWSKKPPPGPQPPRPNDPSRRRPNHRDPNHRDPNHRDPSHRHRPQPPPPWPQPPRPSHRARSHRPRRHGPIGSATRRGLAESQRRRLVRRIAKPAAGAGAGAASASGMAPKSITPVSAPAPIAPAAAPRIERIR